MGLYHPCAERSALAMATHLFQVFIVKSYTWGLIYLKDYCVCLLKISSQVLLYVLPGVAMRQMVTRGEAFSGGSSLLEYLLSLIWHLPYYPDTIPYSKTILF